MKNYLFIALVSLGFMAFAQNKNSLEGVYVSKTGDILQLWLFIEDYSSQISYKDNEYISTSGGRFQFENDKLAINLEYNDADNTQVGQNKIYELRFEGANFKDKEGNLWMKQPTNKQDLDGAWKITGRMQDGKLTEIHQKGERKTLKLLVGGHFQWIAFDPSIKGFYGTGGGIYKFENGKYIETIQFFSRDNSRVGASLSFDGEIKNGDWHHGGLSSKGDPIHEIWSKIR